MPTFAELQTTLHQTQYQRTVLQHLIEYLDENFLPNLDEKPLRVLLTNDKLPVPQAAFDTVVEGLNSWVKSCQQTEQQLLSAPFSAEQQTSDKPQEQTITPTPEAQT